MQRRELVKAAGLAALAGPRAFAADADANTVAAGPCEWRSVPFGAGGFVDGFVFHPRERGLLYARTDIGGAYRFEPATNAWTPLLDHLSKADADLMGVLSLAVDPNDADRLYAACGLYLDEFSRNGALLVSADRGATWQVTELGIKLGGNWWGRGTGERLQVDPNDGAVLLLGTSQDGLMRSADRGQSFKRLDFPSRHVSLVLFDPQSGARGSASTSIYVGSHDRPGLYASHDGGASFARERGAPPQVPQRAVFGPDGTLYVSFALGAGELAVNPGNAKSGGVWKRDRQGRWSDITPTRGGFGYSGLDVDRQVPGRLVVSTIQRYKPGDDLFVSSDDGASWTPLGERSRHNASAYPWLVNYMRGHDDMGHWMCDVKLDPFDGERAIYGTGYGPWITRNLRAAQQGGTVNWDFSVANFEETATLEIRSPSGGAALLAAMGDVSGGAWDDVTRTPRNGLFAPSNETNRSVDFAQLKPAILARVADQARTGGYVSRDGGASWRPFETAPPAPARTRSGHVAVSAQGGFLVVVAEKQNAVWSRDHGRTWQPCSGWPAAPDRSEATPKPVADRAVEGVFYVHDEPNGQILVSTDGGASFKPGIVGLPKLARLQSAQLVCAPGKQRDLWLALPGALLHLPEADQPARTIAAVAEPWMIALGKAAPGAREHALYVWGRVRIGGGAPQEGLFRSDDGGASFVRINDDSHRYGRLLSMTADPLEHGTLYLAPHGRGVMIGRAPSTQGVPTK